MGKMKGTAGREKPQDCIVTVDLEKKKWYRNTAEQ